MELMKTTLAAAAGALALALGAACGDSGDELPQPSPTLEPSPVSAQVSVASGASMIFEGKRYRARDVGPDLVSPDEVEQAGTTTEIDIDHAGPVKVYRLMDDSGNSLFTFQPGPATAVHDEVSTRHVWLEWMPETESPAPGLSPEAAVATTTRVATPYVSEPPLASPFAATGTVSPALPETTPPPVREGPPLEAPLGEFEDDPSLLPSATPPPAQEDPAVQ